MKTTLLVLALLATGCSSLAAGSTKTLLTAHADACRDMAAENIAYVKADTTLADSEKNILLSRDADTATFARKLAESAK